MHVGCVGHASTTLHIALGVASSYSGAVRLSHHAASNDMQCARHLTLSRHACGGHVVTSSVMRCVHSCEIDVRACGCDTVVIDVRVGVTLLCVCKCGSDDDGAMTDCC